MERLSRTDKYKDYRSKINNTSEKEIATNELKEYQEKLIFNEKKFGNTSKTESDLNRGIKGSSLDDLIIDDSNGNKQIEVSDTENHNPIDELSNDTNVDTKIENSNDEKTDINNSDIQEYATEKRLEQAFSEIDKFKKNSFEKLDENDDYINKIKEMVSFNNDKDDESENKHEKLKRYDASKKLSQKNYAEFQPKNDGLDDQQNKDSSDEFSEICDNVNHFIEEIESEDNYSNNQRYEKPIEDNSEQELYVDPDSSPQPLDVQVPENQPTESNEQPVNQQDDSYQVESNFMNDLEKEVDEYNPTQQNDDYYESQPSSDNYQYNYDDDEENQNDYHNTVSLEVNKLLDEINSSKSDNISASDAMNYDSVSSGYDNNQGKTIAFDSYNYNSGAPDNTVVLSNPAYGGPAIHTMSFRTEQLDNSIERKGNTLLNVILTILIIVAFLALGIIVYFFLLTRGII